METNDERRLRKLRELCDRHGVDDVAVKAGLSPPALRQIVKGTLLPAKKGGDRAPRSLGNESARAIEAAYGLPRGWFDNDADGHELAPDALSIATRFNALTGEARGRLFAVLQNLIAMALAMQSASPLPPEPFREPTAAPVRTLRDR